jgi:hypothetical protein
MVATAVGRDEVEKLFLHRLPEIQSRAWAINHRLPPSEREECVAEVTAWCWAWMLAGARKGRLEKMTPRTMAIFASRMFASGRRFAGSNGASDVMSELARASGKTAVCSLDAPRTDGDDNLEERGFAVLRPLRTPKPFDIARCNCDYGLVADDPALSSRAKDVFHKLVVDHERGCCSRAGSVRASRGKTAGLAAGGSRRPSRTTRRSSSSNASSRRSGHFRTGGPGTG